jgi:hypothetical protein
MRKAIKVVGLLVLGAVLGQVFVIELSVLLVAHKVHSSSFLRQAAMSSTAPDEMSNEELAVWNNMRDDIRNGRFKEVNQLTWITKNDSDFKVLPAKPVFGPGDSILAEIRLKNVSDHVLHVNEPKQKKMTLEAYYYQGVNQMDYLVSISPLESTWMRTLEPGEQISIPIIISVTKKGQYQINYSLAVSELNEENSQLEEDAPVSEQAACHFTIQ